MILVISELSQDVPSPPPLAHQPCQAPESTCQSKVTFVLGNFVLCLKHFMLQNVLGRVEAAWRSRLSWLPHPLLPPVPTSPRGLRSPAVNQASSWTPVERHLWRQMKSNHCVMLRKQLPMYRQCSTLFFYRHHQTQVFFVSATCYLLAHHLICLTMFEFVQVNKSNKSNALQCLCLMVSIEANGIC